MDHPLIIALDFEDYQSVSNFLGHFTGKKLFLKVGMELFYQEGPAIVERLKEMDHKVFVDLKLHDIPNTVKRAMKRLAALDCDIVNVHAAGGMNMMESALEGLSAGTAPGRQKALCIAVTQLTSTSEKQMRTEQLIEVPLSQSVYHLADLAKEAGLDGVVCSPLEASGIRERLGSNFLTVTPGIRLETDNSNDQIRIATPEFARKAGVSAIVAGRSITRSQDPLKTYETWLEAWRGRKT